MRTLIFKNLLFTILTEIPEFDHFNPIKIPTLLFPTVTVFSLNFPQKILLSIKFPEDIRY